MLKDLKFICHLDGYNYYLGDVITGGVDWYEAFEIVKELGEGWELPSRAVAILAHDKLREEMQSVVGFYWLGEESSLPAHAWVQSSTYGYQSLYPSVELHFRFVRPVYKEKVV